MAETTTAPAPAAPAAAPSTPAPASTPSTPAAAPSLPRRPPGDRSTPAKPAAPAADGAPPSRLDRLAARADLGPAGQTQAPAAPAKPAAPAPAVEDEPAPEAPITEPEKPATTPATPAKPEPPVESLGLKQLRSVYESTKRERDTLKKQFEELKSKPAEDPEKPKLIEKATKAEKEAEELRKEIEFVDYERSEDYKKTYEKPYVDAFQRARTKMTEFDVALPDGAVRPATEKDFDAIVSLPSNREARNMAKQMFPDDWQSVLALREGVLEKNEARINALDAKRKEGEEVRKQRQEQAVQGRQKLVEELGNAWKRFNEEAHSQFPQYFKPATIDPANPDETLLKANELLEKGYEQAREAMSIMDPTRPDLTPSQREAAIKKHNIMFNKMAAFDRLAYQLVQSEKIRKQLEEKLKGYQASEPGAGDGAPPKAGDAPTDRMSRLSRYAK